MLIEITNRLTVIYRKTILSVFMELVLKHNDLERAAKLAIVFGINAQQLLEQAGDILLTNQEFSRAVACYKLSKVSSQRTKKTSSKSMLLKFLVLHLRFERLCLSV